MDNFDNTCADEFMISVIIPVYNAEKYLSSCLDSVLQQSYKNLQIILINDGSTDSSGDICDIYASRDNRIEVVHCENGGQARARNIGLSRAKGDWIGFVDDDDIIDSNMYSTLIFNAIQHKVLVSGCATMMVEEDGTSYNRFEDMASGIRRGRDIIMDLFYFSRHSYGALWNKIFHISLKEDLLFPEGCQLEDYYVAIKLYYKVGQIFFEQRAMYYWFLRSTSQSHKSFYDGKLTIIKVCNDIVDWMESNTEDKDLISGAYHYRFVSYVDVMSMMWKSKESKKLVRGYLDKALEFQKQAKASGCSSSKMKRASLKCFYWKLFS